MSVKKTLALLVMLLLVCTLLPVLPALAADAPGIDSASVWARDNINSAYNKGFIPEDVQGNYTQNITRSEFCRMSVLFIEYWTGMSIDEVLASKGLERDPDAFDDTDDPDILAACALRVTLGTGNGKFTPDGVFTREQAARMIWNVFNALDLDVSNDPMVGFKDITAAADWAWDSINFCASVGLVRGTSTNLLMFSPKMYYTREQSIIVFDRFVLQDAKYRDFSEHLVINFFAGRQDNWDNALAQADPVLQWLYQKFNFEFNFIVPSDTGLVDKNGNPLDGYQQTDQWMKDGKMPANIDVAFADISTERQNNYLAGVKAGAFRAYDLDQYSNLKMRYDISDSSVKRLGVDGKLYAYPAYIDLEDLTTTGTASASVGFVYRKDWAKTAGLYKESGFYTWDEFLALVKAVQKADSKRIGLTGNPDTITWCLAGSLNPYLNTSIGKGLGKDAQGKYAYGPSLPGSLDAVKLLNSLYQDGIIWKDLEEEGGNAGEEKFNNGAAFASVVYTVGNIEINNRIKSYKGNISDIEYGVFAGPNGSVMKYTQGLSHWSESVMNASMSDAKAYRWQAILDYLTTEEGYITSNIGIKGTDWKYGADARPVQLTTTVSPINGAVGAGEFNTNRYNWARAAHNHDNFQYIYGSVTTPEFMAIASKVQKIFTGSNVKFIQPLVELEYLSGPEFQKVRNSFRNINPKVWALMDGSASGVETGWNSFVTTEIPKYQLAIDEMNATLK